MRRMLCILLALLTALSVTGCRQLRDFQQQLTESIDKPVLYLYPEEETLVTVRLDSDFRLTTTYPAYEDGWTVTAAPDGTLTDESGRKYSAPAWTTTFHRVFASAAKTPPPFWRRPSLRWALRTGRPTNF